MMCLALPQAQTSDVPKYFPWCRKEHKEKIQPLLAQKLAERFVSQEPDLIFSII